MQFQKKNPTSGFGEQVGQRFKKLKIKFFGKNKLMRLAKKKNHKLREHISKSAVRTGGTPVTLGRRCCQLPPSGRHPPSSISKTHSPWGGQRVVAALALSPPNTQGKGDRLHSAQEFGSFIEGTDPNCFLLSLERGVHEDFFVLSFESSLPPVITKGKQEAQTPLGYFLYHGGLQKYIVSWQKNEGHL